LKLTGPIAYVALHKLVLAFKPRSLEMNKNSSFQSAFQSMGEAQVLAAQGHQEIGRLIGEAVTRFFRRVIGRFTTRGARFV